ncbi:NAD(P)H-hydrate dehydratase [Polynucleobacter sp. AP-Feld-500C-C5]|uniref:NAD(P)H-hydrate dehydratase n=1 Tax=Polynucleobacter sp. AP-Feld-500C-C5 TaxID=2576924 RepID=UPI001C0C43F5|nr:NAD(P)H-hydrate dehydratase [Polynucleobacter sp. AP-Feld-500C-C5]MBU3632387.1 NAD(P)H-hydrate dehydratase [Polynucleobacter sp. AP-Feld-500C-C5]
MTLAPSKLDILQALSPLGPLMRLKREPAEHKGHAGKAVLIGGAPGMAGALLLAGNACLHLGAGWTILEMLDPASARADSNQPELMIRLANNEPSEALNQNQPDVIAIGPGLGNSALAIKWLKACLAYPKVPLILDADALNLIADSTELLSALQLRNQQFPGQSILTPHPGEAAQLLKSSSAEIQVDRFSSLHQLVQLTQSMVVLKGQHTLIAGPQHSAVQCEAGNPGMGTGGMGDVLTGSITAIAAQGVHHHLNLWDSSCIAVQLHACAADSLVQKGVGPIGLTPSEVIAEMRSLLNKLL